MPQTILQSIFGYTTFRPLQSEVINNVLARRDTLAVMPTGGGKSLCYQIPALKFAGLTVVVSPLIALMKDQVEQLEALGVPALFLNSTLSMEAYQENMARVRSGAVKLLYVAPETLLTPRLFQLLSSVQLDCLTIDEAHCISEWGHDFRPEYRQLVDVRRRFPKAVCLALTATATERVRGDILSSLGFQQANQFVASFNRPNLFIEVIAKNDAAGQTLDFLQRHAGQSGIIYCFSRKQVDNLAAALARRGYSVLPYHAGLEDAVRKHNQEAFIRDDVQIMVATIAFGMGINKPNVRFIIHYDLPKSIEGYYQEIGRAGRDDLPAHCLLLYSYGDVSKQRYFIDQKAEPERQVAYDHLMTLTRYAESAVCRRIPLLAYFGENYAGSCGSCDNCQGGAGAQTDLTIPAQKFLSCVKRCGERFAATHITNVLLGVEVEEKILRYGHQNLSTFGIGRELTRKQWLGLAQILVGQGLLAQSSDFYRTLSLTPAAYEALKNRTPITGMLPVEEVRRSTRTAEVAAYDQALFELLRKKRKDLADEDGVPPYVIFPDRTLIEMAAQRPRSLEALRRIHGVGAVKLQSYGAAFLEVVEAYCREHNLQAQAPDQASSADLLGRTPRYVALGEAYNQGMQLDVLTERFGLKLSTLLQYLWQYANEGNTLRSGGNFLLGVQAPAALQTAALQAFRELGTMKLRPVFDALNGAVSYDDLRLIGLYFISEG